MKKNNLFVFFLVMVISAGIFTSCNNNTNPPPDGNNKNISSLPDETAPVTLKMCTWWGGETFKALKSVVDAFTEENKNITIDMLLWPYGGDYEQKLVVACASGEGPDIIKLDQNTHFAKYWFGRLLEPLDSYLSDMNYDTSRWLPGVKDAHTYDGQIVAMPLHREQHVTWYNVDLFKQAGLPNLPEQPTWDDIENAAKAINAMGTNENGDRVFGVRVHANYSNCLGIYLNDMGLPIEGDADSARFNTPERIAAARRLFDLQINYGPASGLTFEPMITGVLGMDIGQPTGFINEAGKSLDFETRIVNFPINDSSKGQIVSVSCNSVGLNSKSNNKAAAAKLMAKFASPEGEEMLKTFVLTPAAGNVYEEFVAVKDAFPFDGMKIINPLSNARFSITPKYNWMSRASASFTAVVNGDMSVEDYFIEGQQNIDEYLANPDRDVLE